MIQYYVLYTSVGTHGYTYLVLVIYTLFALNSGGRQCRDPAYQSRVPIWYVFQTDLVHVKYCRG
jgi:hypothetical protein